MGEFEFDYLTELDTVIGSDLFSQDEYIKQYLLDPDLSLISKIRISLRYYITAQPELILQFTVFKDYLEKVNPLYYLKCSVTITKRVKSGNIWIPNDL